MEKHTLGQRILLIVLYSLLLLMVVFSLIALKNKNYEGYQKCVEKKCQGGVYQAYCSKFREVNNCCQGAGGTTAMGSNNQYPCVFT